MSERDMFMWMLKNTEEKLNGKENEKDKSIPEAATKNDDTSEEKSKTWCSWNWDVKVHWKK